MRSQEYYVRPLKGLCSHGWYLTVVDRMVSVCLFSRSVGDVNSVEVRVAGLVASQGAAEPYDIYCSTAAAATLSSDMTKCCFVITLMLPHPQHTCSRRRMSFAHRCKWM